MRLPFGISKEKREEERPVKRFYGTAQFATSQTKKNTESTEKTSDYTEGFKKRGPVFLNAPSRPWRQKLLSSLFFFSVPSVSSVAKLFSLLVRGSTLLVGFRKSFFLFFVIVFDILYNRVSVLIEESCGLAD